ncbi:type VI secretion system tip protein VgrG [Paraburkholderia sp. Se-20369]|nr:type VI secretion system tip protein VgrG [Paraburkholderia sp. Se-20369]
MNTVFDASRTLTVSGDALPSYGGAPVLTPVRLTGTERIGALYEYTLELKTPDARSFSPSIAANIELDKLIGTEITVSIQFEGNGRFVAGLPGDSGISNVGAGTREITGLVTAARILREEGRSIVYSVTLHPWLWLATRNQDCRLFQDMSVVEITDAVLSAYPFPVDKRLTTPRPNNAWPKRDLQRQHWESDWTFLQRLWEEWGIFYFFEHDGCRHRLVLINSVGALKPHGPAYRTIRYEAPDGRRIDEEHIHALTVANALTTGEVTHIDYDYTQPRANQSVLQADPRATGYANQAHYLWGDHAQPQAGAAGLTGEHNQPRTEGEYLALVTMQAMRCVGSRAAGQGNLRGLTTGQTFNLTHYPQAAANREYLVIACRLDIEEVGEEAGARQTYRCQADFEVQLTSEPFRLARKVAKPRTHGPETAVVVGPANREIWTDAYGRVKVQFHWDRQGERDERSSCWVRVSSPWQGNQFGAIHLPRIGQEVIVDHLNGDPDLPIVTGRVVNAFQQPAWRLPGQQALSGFVSKEIGGRQNNVLLHDDTSGEIQTQVRSDHLSSGLHLGYLTRIDEPAGRKEKRGEGVELRTDGHAAVRGARGLLLTSHGRTETQGNAFSVTEIDEQLSLAQKSMERLAETARSAGAHDGEQNDIAGLLRGQADAIKGAGELGEFAQPHLVVSSPAGVAVSTPGQTHLSSGRTTAVTAGEHLSISTGGGVFASVRSALRLFVYRAGMRLVAAGGDIDLKALKDSVNVLAKLNFTVSANRVRISAQQEVEISGGGSYTRWRNGEITHGTTGGYTVHSTRRAFVGPDNVSIPVPPASPPTQESLHFALAALPNDAHRYALEPYELFKGGAKIGEGVTDEYGRVVVDNHEPGTPVYRVMLSNGGQFNLKVSDALAADSNHVDRRSNRGERPL